MNNAIAISTLLVTLAVGAVGIYYASSQATGSGGATTRSSREIALACEPEMGVFHIHPLLEVIVDGTQIEMPANIGVRPTCMTALHTHTADGVLHVEAPEVRDFTLGDFFAVWNQPLNKTQLSEYVTEKSHSLEVKVNDEYVTTGENTILADGDRIQAVYTQKAGITP